MQNTKSSLFRLRHPHISINSCTESGETSATKSRRLWTCLGTQNTAGKTARRNTVGQVVLRAKALDTALSAGVERTDDTEVLGRRPGAGTHIFEATADLLAPGEVGDFAALGCEGRVVGHLSGKHVKRLLFRERVD